MLGHGPPLVKAANWLGHLQFDLDSPIFRHWTRELSRYNEYVRYDDRGCGLSDRVVKSCTFEDWVHDLETVVDSPGVDKFSLLGISLGWAGNIADACLRRLLVVDLVLSVAAALVCY